MNKRIGCINNVDQRLLGDGCYDGEFICIENSYKKRRVKLWMTVTAVALTLSCCLLAVPLAVGMLGDVITDIVDSVIAYLENGSDRPIWITEGILVPSKNTVIGGNSSVSKPDNDVKDDGGVVTVDKLYDFDYSAVPEGHTPIVPMDLSLVAYGDTYIQNSTGIDPDVDKLLAVKLSDRIGLEYLSSSAPTVLIIHTHGTEAYSAEGAVSFVEGGEIARSDDKTENVVAVGKALKDRLDELGIKSIHCEILHDRNGYMGAYDAAKETVVRYMGQYPSIKLVIDLHRDGIVRSSGELVRPVTVSDGEAVAQVMCVVGSDWGGEKNEKWEGNLALALQLRRELNSDGENICRPTYLKQSTYNQEIAPFSLLLEIGAAGNYLSEACLAAEKVAEALAKIL